VYWLRFPANKERPSMNPEPVCVNAQESMPRNRFRQPNVAWQAGTTNRVVVSNCKTGNRFLSSLKGLQARALFSVRRWNTLPVTANCENVSSELMYWSFFACIEEASSPCCSPLTLPPWQLTGATLTTSSWLPTSSGTLRRSCRDSRLNLASSHGPNNYKDTNP